ncbi:hypothetical protein BaRGS_00019453 [Batillaria attramentaria]|uniref:Uncharacterized protein n=1 Tax=Batillaria attramentaria TaxID=370345 RepID=A0ABD0KPZ8_9CAEN
MPNHCYELSKQCLSDTVPPNGTSGYIIISKIDITAVFRPLTCDSKEQDGDTPGGERRHDVNLCSVTEDDSGISSGQFCRVEQFGDMAVE